jgi:hypothetical protein
VYALGDFGATWPKNVRGSCLRLVGLNCPIN